MELDEVRKQTIKRIDHVFPTCVGVVLNNRDFVAQYLEPYRAKRQGVINAYEKKKKIVFCRDCMEGADSRGWVLVYKLFITATTNPLETKKEKWLNCQCQHCDFEINTPVPVPQPAPETDLEKQTKALQDMLANQQIQGQRVEQSTYEQLRQSQQYWGANQQQQAEHMARMYGKSAMLGQSPRMFTDNKTCPPPVEDPTQYTMIQRAKKLMGG